MQDQPDMTMAAPARRLVAVASRIVALYRQAMFALGVIGMASLMAVVVLQIVCRYLLGFSLVWSEEFCRAVLVWITFVFAGLALERGEMVAFEGVSGRLPGAVRIVLLLTGGGVALWVTWKLVALGYGYAMFNYGQVLPALQISQLWVYIALPIGMGLFALHLLLRVILQLAQTVQRVAGKEPAS